MHNKCFCGHRISTLGLGGHSFPTARGKQNRIDQNMVQEWWMQPYPVESTTLTQPISIRMEIRNGF